MSAVFDALDSSKKRNKFWLFSNSMRFHRNVPWNTKAFYVLKKKEKPKAKFLLWAWRWHIWKCMLFLRKCRLNNIEHKQSNYKVTFWEMGHWKFLWNDKQDDIFIILGRTNMGRKKLLLIPQWYEVENWKLFLMKSLCTLDSLGHDVSRECFSWGGGEPCTSWQVTMHSWSTPV